VVPWYFGEVLPVRRSVRVARSFHFLRLLATCVALLPAPGFLLSKRGPVSVRLVCFRRGFVWLLMTEQLGILAGFLNVL